MYYVDKLEYKFNKIQTKLDKIQTELNETESVISNLKDSREFFITMQIENSSCRDKVDIQQLSKQSDQEIKKYINDNCFRTTNIQ